MDLLAGDQAHGLNQENMDFEIHTVLTETSFRTMPVWLQRRPLAQLIGRTVRGIASSRHAVRDQYLGACAAN